MEKNIIKVTISIILIIVISIYILIGRVYAIEPASGNIYEGIDVSSWQRDIDFSQVKDAGIEVVYIKASEGRTLRDPYFEQNYANAKANGLKVGFYHYVTARSVNDAIMQAEFFSSIIGSKEPDCRPAMDFETFGELTVDEINEIGLAFMRRVEELTGFEMVIYSNTYNARTKFEGELTNYPLWVAQWQVNEPSDNGKWDTWAGWQYTSKGILPGINGYVDRDKFTDAMFLNDVPTPDPGPSPEPDPDEYTTIIIQWGDTLSQLAIEYNTTVEELVRLNDIVNPNLIYAGAPLIVPLSGGSSEGTSDETIYIVKRGDTLSKIALEFGTTVNAIAVRNNIKNVNLIYPGQVLVIPSNSGSSGYITYKIQWGDTLWSISRRYGVSIAYLVRLNRIQNPNLIYAGNTLLI